MGQSQPWVLGGRSGCATRVPSPSRNVAVCLGISAAAFGEGRLHALSIRTLLGVPEDILEGRRDAAREVAPSQLDIFSAELAWHDSQRPFTSDTQVGLDSQSRHVVRLCAVLLFVCITAKAFHSTSLVSPRQPDALRE